MSENKSSSTDDSAQVKLAEALFGQAIQDMREMLKEKVNQVLQTLTYREREIIKLRYRLADRFDYTFKEVGPIFKLAPDRVRRIEAKALRNLRHPKRCRQLQGFLNSLAIEVPSDPEGYRHLVLDVFAGSVHRNDGRKPNLFKHATSELSQDAFLCWLIDWAESGQQENNTALHQTGVFLLNKMLELHGITSPPEYKKLKIIPQFEYLDILVLVNDNIAILIEDKVSTKHHDNQLSRYLCAVQTKHPDRRLLAIYFKTGDESIYTDFSDIGCKCFLRPQLLEVLAYGKQCGVDSDIFRDFHSRLIEIDRRSWRNRTRRTS